MLCQAGRRCSVGVVGFGRRWTAVCLIVFCVVLAEDFWKGSP